MDETRQERDLPPSRRPAPAEPGLDSGRRLAQPARPASPRPPAPRPAAPVSSGRDTPKSVGNKLVVGREIRLKGEVSSCELLSIDGEVEASVRCQELIVSESGAFSGDCRVTRADIAGRVEGTLTVAERLTVRQSGRIRGKVRYGELQVEAGGEIAGEIEAGGAPEVEPAPEEEPAPEGEPAPEAEPARGEETASGEDTAETPEEAADARQE